MNCKDNKMRIILCQNAEKKRENRKKEAKFLCFKPYCRNFAPAVTKSLIQKIVAAAGKVLLGHSVPVSRNIIFIHSHTSQLIHKYDESVRDRLHPYSRFV